MGAIPYNQFGFLKGKSTTDSLLIFGSDIQNAFNNNSCLDIVWYSQWNRNSDVERLDQFKVLIYLFKPFQNK